MDFSCLTKEKTVCFTYSCSVNIVFGNKKGTKDLRGTFLTYLSKFPWVFKKLRKTE